MKNIILSTFLFSLLSQGASENTRTRRLLGYINEIVLVQALFLFNHDTC